MQFILKPINDPAAPYGETYHPIFVDSLEQAKTEAERLLNENNDTQPHRLYQCGIMGSRYHCGNLRLTQKRRLPRWTKPN